MHKSRANTTSPSGSTGVHESHCPGTIRTKDVFHAAWLVTCGMEIQEIEFDTGACREKAIFTLQGEDIARYEEQYRLGVVTVNLFALREAVRQVKDAMFGFLRTFGHNSGMY